LRRKSWAAGFGVLIGAAAAVLVIARLTDGSAAPAPPAVSPPSAQPVTPPPVLPLAGGPPEPTPPLVEIAASVEDTAAAILQPADCERGKLEAAQANADTLRTLVWTPFQKPETGWETYAPLIAREIVTACEPSSPAFAAALANWQAQNSLPGAGRVDPATFKAMTNRWALARPFVVASQKGCPAAAALERLQPLEADEIYGKPERLLPAPLAAYRRMLADARANDPAIAADRRLLTVFSGYRDPEADAARCLTDKNCQGVARTVCSAHRTGMAIDLVVGQAAGLRPDSSADANRLAQSKSPAYRWLLANAERYGFRNYAYEPWHWEWAG
jgi:D-alanyl-D-alanine carboxypeptidase